MDFRFTPEQIELRQKAREFLNKEIAPIANDLDSTYSFHVEGADRVRKSGFYGYMLPEDYGGIGVSSINICILREEFSRVCTFADEVLTMQGLGAGPIIQFGTEKQKEKYLPPLADGSKLTNFILTERSSGSDVAGIQATARLDGDYYFLNGRKSYVSKPAHTDFSVIFAKTDPEAGHKGISAFIVDREESEYEVETDELIFECNIGEIIMKDMRVPKGNLLGEEGQGMRVALGNLDVFRPTVGAGVIGMAGRALDLALEYAKHREMFGQHLADFQITQCKLAEMKVELDAASLLVYRAAWLADNVEGRTTLEASSAKYFATEMAHKIIDQSLQIHGGIGLNKKSRIEHLYRAVRAPRIYEGTSEIQLLVIARQLMRLENLNNDSRL